MQLYRYDLPLLSSPLKLSMRTGLILRKGNRWGEIAPLPGFSHETLEEALEDLEQQRLPSVQFGFACLNKPFPKKCPPILINALASSFEEVELAVSSRFRTVKIKATTPEETLLLISRIKQFGLTLRIDVNRQWNFSQALDFFKNLEPGSVEYIEEPLEHPEGIFELPTHPLALDETLLQDNAEKFCKAKNVLALILKPTLLGNKINLFLPMKKKKIFSSSFETSIGLLHIAEMQARYAPEHAAGLDTVRFFKTPEKKWLKIL